MNNYGFTQTKCTHLSNYNSKYRRNNSVSSIFGQGTKTFDDGAESEDLNEIANTVSTLVEACTSNTVEAKSSPVFDIEYLFMKIRAKSVGETAKVIVTCPDDEKTKVQLRYHLMKLKYKCLTSYKCG